jgi:RNA polymerase sigma-70 factor (ECF subfamily)
VAGAGVKQIGQIYRVSQSTVSRWLARIRGDIAREVRSALRARLQLAPDEIESLMALVASQLDINVSGLLLS